ncbi:MAG: ABC transporter substrate-binding protein [Actinomycetota bacterium]
MPCLGAALALAGVPAVAAAQSGGTLTVATEENPDFLDPGFAYTSESWQILANTGNGLLALRREEGAAGAQVVPDLARDLPEVTDGGRTLRFTLRRGIRFSPPVNREVRPSDVKATLERLFVMRSGNAAVYADIVGAEAMLRTGRGTLTGVDADDDAGTVTIRLVRPDPSFLAALALPFAFVQPRETAPVDQSTVPPVATGPYRVTSYEPNRTVVLERNPSFQPWTTEIPRGEVDRIVIRIGVTAAQALQQIAAGDLDYTQSRVTTRLLERVDRSAVVVRRNVEPATYYYFMNVNVAPFDDIRVRRAVALAIDRRAIVDLFRGEAVPTAQILPPGVPGYRRLPLPAGPQIARARALVRQAGADGDRVTVWGHDTDPSPAVTRHLAATLRTLGFRVTIRLMDKPTLLTTLGVRRTGAQVGYARWRHTIPDGADWFRLLVDGDRLRPSENLNYSYIDDASLNRLIDRAAAATDPARRAAAWAGVERAVADRIPVVPFANSVRIEAMSPRVRGYVFHQTFGFLWAKASVR